ncbi:MAG: MBL fold metallo-hydrolase [Actinomycetota bacterium]|jgi:flavorubredoxin|nr:MBL fold metallo-hydrolase [Actinomycetota bacterium]
MDTSVTEVADGIYRLSTYRDPPGMVFNQFLVVDEEPLVFHLGHRRLFPQVQQALARVLDPRSVRWVSFGHIEADECGAMNDWLALAPRATVVHGTLGVSVSLDDMADRQPHSLADGASLDLGAKRVVWIDTPQLPHGWEAALLFETTTATLFAGDLFTIPGRVQPTSEGDIVTPALDGEDRFRPTALTASTAPRIRSLAQFAPRTIATMHGPTYTGDCRAALQALGDGYDARFRASLHDEAIAHSDRSTPGDP